ncbi:hypothetical protein B0H34DRAFT_653545 [Crassisporium funariophilum]|nr:hypothetical protein B0H34DRAFT_653545 [Crassisporium funariophilum]
MSEYWVSKKKYFCKYCEIYIADDAPSKQQHENGLRHKGNVERFIRGIYKQGEKQKKDLEEEKREMKRVEQAANAAFAQDVGAGIAKASAAPVASTSTAAKKPVTKPSNPFANYSTAQSLGYEDPDAERIATELELRRSQGVAGEWQIITAPQPPVGSSLASSITANPSTSHDITTGEGGVKREAEAPPDDDDTRSFKLRKKTVTAGLGEIYDPGLIPIKLKKKEVLEETKPIITPAGASSSAGNLLLPKWTSVQWKRPGEGSSQPQTSQIDSSSTRMTNAEAASSMDIISSGSTKWAKPEWSAPLPDIKQEERGKIFGYTEGPEPSLEEALSDERNLDIKTEEGIKAEDRSPPLPVDQQRAPSGSLFKKRKTPAGPGRGPR